MPDENDFDRTEWDARVEEIAANGGVKHQPNGLPIRIIRHDGHMFECEDADHPNYICPITVMDPGFKEDFPETSGLQTHAMIFNDGNLVITKYETCYGVYSRKNKFKASADCFWKDTYLPEKTIKFITEKAYGIKDE